MTSGIIIQARFDSTRLPGKAMMKIGDRTILEHVIDSCLEADVDYVIVATTSSQNNKPIIRTVQHHYNFNDGFYNRPLLDIYVYNGNEDDVLSRTYFCAKEFNLDTIIRITSDCFFIMPNLIDLSLKCFNHFKPDYLSALSYEGTDVEVFSFDALQEAYIDISTNINHFTKKFIEQEKEHVTKYIRSSGLFKTIRLEDIHLSIDTLQDFEQAKSIYANTTSQK